MEILSTMRLSPQKVQSLLKFLESQEQSVTTDPPQTDEEQTDEQTEEQTDEQTEEPNKESKPRIQE
jgi:hypothetical protein